MRCALWVIASAAATFAGFNQSVPSIESPAASISVASPSFSDQLQYNSYDFCNSPLGLLERENSRVQVNVGLRSLRLKGTGADDSLGRSAQSWNIPDILIGKPQIAYLRLTYSPATIADNPIGGGGRSLPLQRFGLTVAAQVPSGIFQIGIRAKGFIGDETGEGSPNSRSIMGLDELSLALGSRLHEMVVIGMTGGVTAKLDTLRNYDTLPYLRPDRYFTGQIPVLGWYVDFGKEGFPLASDIAFQTATARFIGVDDTGSARNQAPIKGDSLAFAWQTIASLSAGDYVFHPAFSLSYWKNAYQLYAPTPDNNSLGVGPDIAGKDWTISDFGFGLGGSVQLARFATAWIEFSHNALGLHVGDALADSINRSEGYYRFGVGVEAALHALSFLKFPSSIEAFVRLGYFAMRDNGGINSFRSDDFGLLTDLAVGSQAYRSLPDFGWGPEERVSGFTFGFGSAFFDNRLRTDAHLAVLSQSLVKDYHGIEFGVDCIYTLR
jgi:hypothetical protein